VKDSNLRRIYTWAEATSSLVGKAGAHLDLIDEIRAIERSRSPRKLWVVRMP
jgi:hypothetical protein